jgi:hypothetical protein
MVLAIYQIILHLNKITECLKITTFKIVFTFDVFLSAETTVDGQNHEILKLAISGFYIRFHPVYRPCFYFIRKQMTPFY